MSRIAEGEGSELSKRGAVVWFIVGAGMGCAQLAYGLIKWPRDVDRPILRYAFAAVMGAAVYGSILWMADRLLGG